MLGKGEIKKILVGGNKLFSFTLIQKIKRARKECHCQPEAVIFAAFISHCVPCHNLVGRQSDRSMTTARMNSCPFLIV